MRPNSIEKCVCEEKKRTLTTQLHDSVNERLKNHCHAQGIRITHFIEIAVDAALKRAGK